MTTQTPDQPTSNTDGRRDFIRAAGVAMAEHALRKAANLVNSQPPSKDNHHEPKPKPKTGK